jgi:CBS domain containing-hemolysin-like protein
MQGALLLKDKKVKDIMTTRERMFSVRVRASHTPCV